MSEETNVPTNEQLCDIELNPEGAPDDFDPEEVEHADH